MTPVVTLKPGREKSVLNRHPWIFSGAIKRVDGQPAAGDPVAVHDSEGSFLAWGYFNRRSQITVRLLSWNHDEPIDASFWRVRLAASLAARHRASLSAPETTAWRLVYAESDGIPGLVVDRYDNWLVAQFLTAGTDVRKPELARMLLELVPEADGVYERSDVDVREKEGLAPSDGPLLGGPPPAELIVWENGLRFPVDVQSGHKTGLYLDQRENRALLERYASGADLLNCFAYTGGFGIYAARGRASQITHVETSADALAVAERTMALNGLADVHSSYLEADVFQQLRRFRDTGRAFDLIVLDPPKFAHSQRGINRAARGYKDINWLAMRLLRPGGILFTFSCSGVISADLFQKILFGAALDAERDVRIIGRMTQAADHPVLLTFPEAEYLKGMICQVA
jgi:23S rRNA (cytosine1962-C5)-methyltransferase